MHCAADRTAQRKIRRRTLKFLIGTDIDTAGESSGQAEGQLSGDGEKKTMNMLPYRHAIIGTGRPLGSEGATGYGMAHHHYKGFQATGRVALAAIGDIDEGHARAFLADYGQNVPIYLDYRDLLR